MGGRKIALVVESFSEIAHQMGKESGELHRYASFRMCVDNFQICRTFRIGY